ncbi:tryptophan-rich sensory protein [bacterium]|nr:tryptophan-rich sensory protein [bacterium]
MFNSFWYYSLNKPFLMPPNQVFLPVWVILYFTIFLSLILFIIKKSNHKKLNGYIYFIIQMILNVLWAPVFFGLEQMQLGLLIIIFLDIFVYLTFKEFKKISNIAGLLLIPYFIWVIFATYLVVGINVLNF